MILSNSMGSRVLSTSSLMTIHSWKITYGRMLVKGDFELGKSSIGADLLGAIGGNGSVVGIGVKEGRVVWSSIDG